MSSLYYQQGYNAGCACASTNRDTIRKCSDTEDVSLLAGEKLEEISKEDPPWYTHTANWKVGFWDGFVSKAEEMR